MERVKTGIQGLDSILEGGFPHPSSILVAGPTGVGKTVLGLQFLYEGAKKYKEPGFLVKIEGYDTDLQWYAERFNWDIHELQDKGKLIFSSYDPADFEKFDLRTLHSEVVIQLEKIVDSIKAQRVVIDSITPLGLSINDNSRFRTLLYYISKALKEKDCTTLFISERTDKNLTPFGVEQFVADGVLDMDFIETKHQKESQIQSTLVIKKMIATSYPLSRFSVDITDKGMRIIP